MRTLCTLLLITFLFAGCDIIGGGGSSGDLIDREIGNINGVWEGLYYQSSTSGVFVESAYVTVEFTTTDSTEDATAFLDMWAIYSYGDGRSDEFRKRGDYDGNGFYRNGFLNLEFFNRADQDDYLVLNGRLSESKLQVSMGGRGFELEKK